MRLLLAILLILALVTPSFTQVWSNCGTAADKFQITSVVLDPPTPVKGQPITISASGDLDETVTGGTVSVKVKYGFITLINKSEGICSSQDPLSCPIAAGPYSKTITETIPADAPSGKYTGNVVIVDQNNAEIACVDVDINL
ncbi:hypothetical protein RB653_004683 [Dictyostelium firmibasis]|uniref:MD-2-related lipid-recognition domain-containing protein n=1 Tax=Dictyostelium firmibasis TaxID=79012 RepID=A0AAN7UA26_9MYCE